MSETFLSSISVGKILCQKSLLVMKTHENEMYEMFIVYKYSRMNYFRSWPPSNYSLTTKMSQITIYMYYVTNRSDLDIGNMWTSHMWALIEYNPCPVQGSL